MSLSLTRAKELKPGENVYFKYERDSKGAPRVARVNGVVKTWKTRPDEVQVPMKYGFRECFYITERNLDQFTLDAPPIQKKLPMRQPRKR